AKLGDTAEIDGATLDLSLGLAFSHGFTVTGPTLTGAHIDHLKVNVGDFMSLVADDTTIPSFSPAPGQPLVTFGGDPDHPFQHPGASVVFDQGADALAGWGGAAGNFAIAQDFHPILEPHFFADVQVPSGTQLGLPDFLPLHIDQLGIELPNVDLGNIPPGGF